MPLDPTIPLQVKTDFGTPVDAIGKWQALATAGAQQDYLQQQTANARASNPGIVAKAAQEQVALEQVNREMAGRKLVSKYLSESRKSDGTVDTDAAYNKAMSDGADAGTLFTLMKSDAEAKSATIKSKDDAIKVIDSLGDKAANQMRLLNPNDPNDQKTILGILHATNQIASGISGPQVAKDTLGAKFGLNVFQDKDENGNPVQPDPTMIAKTAAARAKQMAEATISPQQAVTNKLNQGQLAVSEGQLAVAQKALQHTLETSGDTTEGRDPESQASKNMYVVAENLGISLPPGLSAFEIMQRPGMKEKLGAAGPAAVNTGRGTQAEQAASLKSQADILEKALGSIKTARENGSITSSTPIGSIFENIGGRFGGNEEIAQLKTWRDNYNRLHPEEPITDKTAWGTVEGKFGAAISELRTSQKAKETLSGSGEFKTNPSVNSSNKPTQRMKSPGGLEYDIPIDEVDEARQKGFTFIKGKK